VTAMIEAARGPGAGEHARFIACLALAGGLHAALGLGIALRVRRTLGPVAIVSEVELVPVRTPAPEPKSEPAFLKPAAPTPAALEARARSTRPQRAAALQAAPAAKLLTADETATADRNDEPVRFVSDPNGRTYGFGLVAHAGTAPATPSATQPVRRAAAVDDGITPADQLERAPSLLAPDGCRGYFPKRASADRAEVALVAVVAADGAVARLEIVAETPRDQGFADAARTCLREQRFAPALDQHGRAVRARTRIKLRFSR
jgi:TonB-like protein